MDREENMSTEAAQKDISLGNLIKEAAELSKASALVNLAYARAKIAEKAKEGYSDLTSTIDAKVTAAVGKIKENSSLYDATKLQKDGILAYYKTMVEEPLTEYYDSQRKILLAKKAELEMQNVSLAADSQNLKQSRMEAKKRYKENERAQNNKGLAQLIADKRSEAERLSSQGDLEGAKKAIDEYKKLKTDLIMQTTDGMMDIALTSQRAKENIEQLRANKEQVKQIDEQLQSLEREAMQKLEEMRINQDKDLMEVKSQNSIFKRISMFMSKNLMRAFNKAKAVETEVVGPMKAKIAAKVPKVEQTIGSKVTEVRSKGKEFFRDKLDKVMQFGRDLREGAIDKLSRRNQSIKQKMSEKQQYLDGERE